MSVPPAASRGASPSFEELARLEPRLAELERRVAEIRDPGDTSFFCSNHVWLPLASELRNLVGVYRPGWSSHAPGDPLYDSNAYELCYGRLSRLLPPCRDCGCVRFQPWRDRQTEELRPEGPPA